MRHWVRESGEKKPGAGSPEPGFGSTVRRVLNGTGAPKVPDQSGRPNTVS
jgi:hypothetical protein